MNAFAAAMDAIDPIMNVGTWAPFKRTVFTRAIFVLEHQIKHPAAQWLATQLRETHRDVVSHIGNVQYYVERVLKPTKKEWTAIEEILSGKRKPETEREEKLATAMREIFDDYADWAERTGIEIVTNKTDEKGNLLTYAFQKHENYFPRMVRMELLDDVIMQLGRDLGMIVEPEHALQRMARSVSHAMKKDRTQKLIESFMKKNNISSKGQAYNVLKQYVSSKTVRRQGNIERARTQELPEEFYEKNPKKVFYRYIFEATQRLSEAERYGVNYEKAYEQIASIPGDWNREFSYRIFARELGLDSDRLAVGKLLGILKAYNVIHLMGLSWLPNASQRTLIAAYTGRVRDLVKSLVPFGGYLSKDQAIRAGAIVDTTIQEMFQDAYGPAGRASEFFLGTVTPFLPVERGNRIVSYRLGAEWAQDLYAKYTSLREKAAKS